MFKVKTAFTVLLTVSLLGIAACSDDDGDEGGTTTGAEEAGTTAGGDETETSAKESGEPILIKTHVASPNGSGETPPMGEVLSGSTIGDSAFCAGGRFSDGPEKPPLETVVRIFRCPGGTLTITFTTTKPGLKQSGDWKVVKGLVRYEGLSGGGRMKAVFESRRGEGRETFTGTVTR
jgi:hypothetical protein